MYYPERQHSRDRGAPAAGRDRGAPAGSPRDRTALSSARTDRMPPPASNTDNGSRSGSETETERDSFCWAESLFFFFLSPINFGKIARTFISRDENNFIFSEKFFRNFYGKV